MTESDTANLSRLREMAVRGRDYRTTNEYDYFGESMELAIGPLEDDILLPIAGMLEDRFGYDEIDEAAEEIEESRDEQGDIDPASLDEEFVHLMAQVCVHGIDTTQAAAEGETEAGLREILGIADNEEENIGFRRGLTLEISQDVLNISSDAEDAEKFRR
jgi:hypothetical protein